MAVVHYDPYAIEFDEAPEKTPCGVRVPECDYPCSASFKDVTCKRCIRMKQRLTREVDETEKDRVNQMGEMAGYFSVKDGE